MYAKLGFAANANDLLKGVHESVIFITQVAGIAAAITRGYFCQLDDFLRRRIDAGLVLESGTEANSACPHILLEQCLHRFDFGGSGMTTIITSHHRCTQAAVSREYGDVDGDRMIQNSLVDIRL